MNERIAQLANGVLLDVGVSICRDMVVLLASFKAIHDCDYSKQI